MRRFALAASLVMIALGASAQPAISVWQLDFNAANITAGNSKFRLTAGAMQWNASKPEQSTIALSLDTTTLSDEGVKNELDAAHFPELRIISAAPARMSGGKGSMPAEFTVRDTVKPVILTVSYKSASPRQITLHAEGTIRASDFKLKGGDIALVIDAPFHPALAQ